MSSLLNIDVFWWDVCSCNSLQPDKQHTLYFRLPSIITSSFTTVKDKNQNYFILHFTFKITNTSCQTFFYV